MGVRGIAGVRPAVFAVLLTACAAPSFAPAPDSPLHIDDVTLADDRRSVTVEFIGGAEFDPNDPCSVAYDGTTRVVDEELQIGIFARRHPKPLPPNTACSGVGYARELVLRLDEPFTGSTIRSLAGEHFSLVSPSP